MRFVIPIAAWLSAAAQAEDGASYEACRDLARAGPYAEAEAACRECAAEGPRAGFCAGRVAWLGERRDADGGFAALTALQAARRGTGGAEEVRAVRDGSAPPTIRAEAAVWLAEQARRRADFEGMLAALDPVWPLPDGVAEAAAGRVIGLRAVALAELGRDDEAREVEAAIRVAGADRPSPAEQVAARRARERGAVVAGAVLGGFLLVAGPLAARGWARTPRPVPLGLLPLVALLGGTWALCEAWAPGAGRMLPPMAVGLVGVHLVAAGARASAWRRLVGGYAAVASVAVAWLALWYTGTLEQVGL